MLANQQQIDSAIHQTEKIESFVKQIYELNKSAFDGNKLLTKSFSDFFRTIEETKQKLYHPTLSIAMVGTTSAGKSTIVNALSGRDIAPMERKEMSAGVLRFIHSEERAINISKTKGARWPHGITQNLSDNEMQRVITKVYDTYKKYIKVAAAPEITVSCPLQWQINRGILDLPNNLSVEFIDLPGLKTLTDEKNLQVIQSALSKSLCIIAMDFNDVDDTRIQRLLEELKDIVKAMSGRTDSLLFLLNKVDDIKSNDVPVEYVIDGGEYLGRNIKGLKSVITESLSLSKKSSIKVIPFVGLLLYHIEQSISKNNQGEIIGYDRDKLNKLFEDYEGIFGKNKKNFTEEEKKTYRTVQLALEDDEDISFDVLAKFSELCYKLSHASEFYDELRTRINERFDDIIIRPILWEMNAHLEKLLADITTYININKKSSKLELYSELLGVLKMKCFLLGTKDNKNFCMIREEAAQILKDIDNSDNIEDEGTQLLYNRIKHDIEEFCIQIEERQLGYIDSQIENINDSISEIITNLLNLQGADNINRYLNSIKETNRSVSIFNGISSVPENIKKRLITEVISPFRKSIEEKKTKGKFIEIASETLPSVLAKDLSDPYENLSELFYTTFSSFTKGDLFFEKKADTEFSSEWESKVNKTYKYADIRMRDVLSKRTNYYFQLDTNTFICVLNKYLNEELSVVLKELKKKLKYNETDLSVLIDNLMNVKRHEIIVPDTLFQFATPQGVTGEQGEESRRVFDYYKHHSCRADEAVYKTVYDKYYLYKYETAKSIYMRWDAGIDKSFAPFWTIITMWVKDSIQSYMDNIRESSLQVAEMTTSFLDEKIELVNANNEENLNIYCQIEEIIQQIRSLKPECYETYILQ